MWFSVTIQTLIMKNHAVLHSDDWDSLINIQRKLALRLPLTQHELDTLAFFLGSLPPPEAFTFSEKDIPDTLGVTFVNDKELRELTDRWVMLFKKLPYSTTPIDIGSWIDVVKSGNASQVSLFIFNNTFIVVDFYPTPLYAEQNICFEVVLRNDGSAIFEYSDEMNEQEAQDFPLFGTFQGSWKEAYLLIIQTLLAHWPKEEFPKEFQSLTFH